MNHTDLLLSTRFAPSPTGLLHLGHAYSAMLAFDFAKKASGKFHLRIEDIDQSRSRPKFEEAIYEDLAWLGIAWETPVRRQSDHWSDYQSAIDRLTVQGLTYPCFCTRKEIAEEINRSQSAPHGPDGPLYPGTCRALTTSQRQDRIEASDSFALRLDLKQTLKVFEIEAEGTLTFEEKGTGPNSETGRITARPEILGDIVLARKDTPTSYHVSVVVDDALQGITHVVRGMDLFHATHIHCVLQKLWGLPTPEYRHHPLITDIHGKRFAKRDQSQTIRALRQSGVTPVEVRERLHLHPSS